MATVNPFDLLGDGDAEDPSLIAAQQKIEPKKTEAAPAKQAAGAKLNKAVVQPNLPTKPLPPARAGEAY